MLLLLIGPTIFFLPKFYEIRTDYKLYKIPKSYNCSEVMKNDTEYQFQFDEKTGISSLNSTIFKNHFVEQLNQMEFICNKSKYLINSLVDDKSNLSSYNDSYTCEPQKELIDRASIAKEPNVTLHMDYNVQTQIARVCQRHVIPFVDRTDLRKNPLYYKIYILGLTTLFAQIIPMGILIYLNIKICLALKTTTGDTLDATIRNQRRNNEKGSK